MATTEIERPGPHPGRELWARVVLAGLSLGAAALHFVVLGEHFDEYVLFGLFFTVVAWGQALWAIAVVVHPSRRLLLWGAVGNLAVGLIWLYTRTVSVPLGPAAGEPEAASLIDILSTIIEVLLAGGAVMLASEKRRAAFTRATGALATSMLVLGAVIATTTWAMVDNAGGGGHSHGASSEYHHAEGEPAPGGLTHDHHARSEPSPGGVQPHTITVPGGEVEGYVDPDDPGAGQVHLTFFAADGSEMSVVELTLTAVSGKRSLPLDVTRLSDGHYVSATVPPGTWDFQFDGHTRNGGHLHGGFQERVEE